mmetsp:Transcript_21447/g.70915  ORF Transcript_21447/g.70915 Transcript_21447/m.70915 type:complete len:273 (+) Transcript_21447:974-1792(+)
MAGEAKARPMHQTSSSVMRATRSTKTALTVSVAGCAAAAHAARSRAPHSFTRSSTVTCNPAALVALAGMGSSGVLPLCRPARCQSQWSSTTSCAAEASSAMSSGAKHQPATSAALAAAFFCILACVVCCFARCCSAVGLDAAFRASFWSDCTRSSMARASGDACARRSSLRVRCTASAASASAEGLPLHGGGGVVTDTHSVRSASDGKALTSSSAASASMCSGVGDESVGAAHAGAQAAVAASPAHRSVAPHGRWSDGEAADGMPIVSRASR